jgi:hypothetical protein
MLPALPLPRAIILARICSSFASRLCNSLPPSSTSPLDFIRCPTKRETTTLFSCSLCSLTGDTEEKKGEEKDRKRAREDSKHAPKGIHLGGNIKRRQTLQYYLPVQVWGACQQFQETSVDSSGTIL